MATLRRSERIQQIRRHATTLADNSDDSPNFREDMESSVDSEEQDISTSHTARQKRQKTEHTAIENALDAEVVRPGRPDKYVRGRRGYLKFMTEMPLDTIYEILRQLDPLDLLYLSWTSKRLHGIVMDKSFIRIWGEAYERLYGSENPPPHCPEDMNFAQYTRFLYHDKCMVCETQIGRYTSWILRLRACNHCLNSDRFSIYPWPDHELCSIHGRSDQYVWTHELEEAKENTDCSARRQLRNDRLKGSGAFYNWRTICYSNRSRHRDRKRAERKIAIFKKLEEIGWTESSIKEINNGRLPDDLPGFGVVKKLTKHDWKLIRPKIVVALSKMKKAYLARCKQSVWTTAGTSLNRMG